MTKLAFLTTVSWYPAGGKVDYLYFAKVLSRRKQWIQAIRRGDRKQLTVTERTNLIMFASPQKRRSTKAYLHSTY